MALLNLLLCFAVLQPVLAAPISDTISDAIVTWVPENFQSSIQDIIDFLNPRHSPSVNQALISSLVLIFISALSAGPAVISYPKNANRFQAFQFRLSFFLYGLVSPDFYVTRAWKEVIAESAIAQTYNKLFLKDEPRKNKWGVIHGAFIANRGFVLKQDDKPAKPLSFKELVQMIKTKKIDPPIVSKQDILSRSKRFPHPYIAWLPYLPLYWFLTKFKWTLPTLVILAYAHGFISWYAFVWRSLTITSVVEPIVIAMKPDSGSKPQEDWIPMKDMTVLSEKVLDASLIPVDADNKDVDVDAEKSILSSDAEKSESMTSDAVLPEEAEDDSSTGGIVGKILYNLGFCLTFTVTFIFVGIITQLCIIFRASTVPLRDQWNVISQPRNVLTIASYIAGTTVSCMIWILFFMAGIRDSMVPSGVERQIWFACSLFLLLQPVLLLLAPRRLRMKIHESVRTGFYVVYSLIYSAARLSLFFLAFYGARKAF